MAASRTNFYFRFVPKYLFVGLVGALIAGVYGVFHDQVTYTISTEYFTRFKFFQFRYADPGGGSPRVFVGIIGFLATWWVGLISGWLLARFAVLDRHEILPTSVIVKHFAVVIAAPFLFGLAGWGWGQWRKTTGYAEGWLDMMDDFQVHDQEAFMTVGYIHNFGYGGALFGLLIAIFLIYRTKCRWRKSMQRR